MVCAGGSADKDVCYGDSGGPLVAQRVTEDGTATDVLVGVVSWSVTCDFEDPSVYASVAYLRGWVDSVVAPTNATSAAP